MLSGLRQRLKEGDESNRKSKESNGADDERQRATRRRKHNAGESKSKNIMSSEVRRLELESDPWTFRVQEHTVVCKACKKTIALDSRSLYYRGLWDKHRGKCSEMRKLKRHNVEPNDISMEDTEVPRNAPPIFVMGSSTSQTYPQNIESPYKKGGLITENQRRAVWDDLSSNFRIVGPENEFPESGSEFLNSNQSQCFEDRENNLYNLMSTSGKFTTVTKSFLRDKIWCTYPFSQEETDPGQGEKYRYSSVGELQYGYYRTPEYHKQGPGLATRYPEKKECKYRSLEVREAEADGERRVADNTSLQGDVAHS